jgi:FkbM family methyltransferase
VLREIVRCAPHGQHIAYEPLPELAARLAREFPEVDVRNAAVSNKTGKSDFYRVRFGSMQSGLKRREGVPASSTDTIIVKTEKLDNDLPAGYIPDLIKIDVEGGERQVIEGAIETISRHAPIVCFEHGPGAEYEYNTSPKQVYDLLVREAGLRIFDIDGYGPYSEDGFVAVFDEPIWNFVAHR